MPPLLLPVFLGLQLQLPHQVLGPDFSAPQGDNLRGGDLSQFVRRCTATKHLPFHCSWLSASMGPSLPESLQQRGVCARPSRRPLTPQANASHLSQVTSGLTAHTQVLLDLSLTFSLPDTTMLPRYAGPRKSGRRHTSRQSWSGEACGSAGPHTAAARNPPQPGSLQHRTATG